MSSLNENSDLASQLVALRALRERIKDETETLEYRLSKIPVKERIVLMSKLMEGIVDTEENLLPRFKRKFEEYQEEIIRELIIPLIPTLEWAVSDYGVRARAPDFIKKNLKLLLTNNANVGMYIEEKVYVSVYNQVVSLSGKNVVPYAIKNFGLDFDIWEQKASKSILDREIRIRDLQKRLDADIEEKERLYGSD